MSTPTLSDAELKECREWALCFRSSPAASTIVEKLCDHIAALQSAPSDSEIAAMIEKLELRRDDAAIGKQHYSLDEVVANMKDAASLLRRQSLVIEGMKKERDALREAVKDIPKRHKPDCVCLVCEYQSL